MDLYRHGVTGKLAEYAAKKYKSHRRIPENVWEELRTNYRRALTKIPPCV